MGACSSPWPRRVTEVVGMDLSQVFLQHLQERLEALSPEVRRRVTFRRADVIEDEWPNGFDVVLLAANCLYELATAQEQEHCIKCAAEALVPGGHLYLDNDHMEGELDPSWCRSGIRQNVFPTGICADGTRVWDSSEVIWYDKALSVDSLSKNGDDRNPRRTSLQTGVDAAKASAQYG